MGRIVGANGLPAGLAPAVLRPGEEQARIDVGIGPAGVILTITIGGVPRPIPLPPGTASQLGTMLIGLDAISQANRQPSNFPIVPDPPAERAALPAPEPGPAEDLLDEAIKNVTFGD